MTTSKMLTDEVIVGLIKEEYDKKLKILDEKLKIFFKDEDGEKKKMISPSLKIHKKSGELFTVDQVGSWGAILSFVDDTGVHTIKVDKDTLEQEYEL